MLEALEPRTLLTAAPSVPTGSVTTFNTTTIAGWAFNADDGSTPMNVIITIDGAPHTLSADISDPALASKHLGSTDHDFSYAVGELATGKHSVTIDIADPSTNTVLKRLKSGTLTVAPPNGSVEVFSASTISGYATWAENPADAVQIVITVDGTAITLPADNARPDLLKKLGTTSVGFSYSLPALHPGNNAVSVAMIDPSSGGSKIIKSGNINIGAPTGGVTTFTTSGISGWAYNPADANAPVNIQISVNGNTTTLTADDFQAALVKSTGSGYHGFTFSFPTDPSNDPDHLMLQPVANTVTVTLVDPYTGQTKVLKSATLTNHPPTGTVDIHTNTEIAGWVSDSDSINPVMVQIDVNGVAMGDPFLANNTRKITKNVAIGFDVTGDFAGKVVEVFAFDASADVPVLIWTNNHPPKGAATSITGFNVSGWAVDPDDLNTPVTVQVYIDGALLTSGSANLADAADAKKAGADNAGFSIDIGGLAPGKHTISVYALDGEATSAKPVLIGSKTVTDAPPVGDVETVSDSVVSGWALDPDLGPNPAQVSIYVDQQLFATIEANGNRPDLVSKYKSPNHGFTLTFSDFFDADDLAAFQAQSHSITVTVLDDRVSDNRNVVIYDGFINNHTPQGAIESTTPTAITGWALDPDTTDAIPVDMYVDGKYSTTVTADQDDTVQDGHGFQFTMPALSFGNHTLTFYAAESQGNLSTLIGTTSVSNSHAIGAVESYDGAHIIGWADDPDQPDQNVQIQVFINGQLAATGTADQDHDNLPASIGSTNHGFAVTLPTLSAGTNQIDVYAVDLNNGLLSYLGTQVVTISAE